MSRYEIRYAKSDDLNIAYQVTGTGSRDVVLISGFVSHLEMDWMHPAHAHFLNRLGTFCRLIRFDKRGTGLSDRPGGLPDLETRMDDVRAVMDAVGCDRATLFGYSEGGPMAILFAATFPEKAEKLVLYGTYARRLRDLDYPWGKTEEARQAYAEHIEKGWGWEADMHIMCPNADEALARWWRERARAAASPGAARDLIQMNSLVDVREVLPAVGVPTLVIHRVGDKDSQLEEGRYIANRIPGAEFVELEGSDHFVSIEPDQILDHVERFVTGSPSAKGRNRRLATVLFADISGSTEKAADMGDERWADLLDQFLGTSQAQLALYEGRLVKTTGDGFLAVFEGPARAVRCACSIRDAGEMLGLRLRCGVHSSEVEFRDGDVAGIGVHVAARAMAAAAVGEVLVSRTVKDLIAGSDIETIDRGEHRLRGIEETWRLYAVPG